MFFWWVRLHPYYWILPNQMGHQMATDYQRKIEDDENIPPRQYLQK